MSWNNQAQPSWGQPPVPPHAPTGRPGWARKRIVIPSALGLLVVGSILGSAGSGGAEPVADAKPAPTVTVTVTAKPVEEADAKSKPKPTVTVTKTVTAEPKAKPKPKEDEEAAPKGQAVFKVWGTAPNGVSVTYGSDSENLDGSGLPMTKALKVKDDALYYMISAQLQGGGEIQCSVTIGDETKKGRARGDYNICMVQLNGDFLGGFS
ncbi:hypothetical protein [Streptomyces sp. NPDC059258]|uniref:hypothetical protein n=1 Tax=unclassified Streptomyces TaxID=2593676 RepID=UPI0036BFB9E0